MKTFFKKIRDIALGLAMTLGVVTGVLSPAVASANSAVFVPNAKVSFTFDDGMASSILAAQTLQPYGYSGTQYVITGCVGMTTHPNTCAAGQDYSYLTWDQIAQLRNTYGWEIGSHSASHASFQTLNATQAAQELTQSRDALKAKGYNPTAFAFPYGEYNDVALAEAAKVYSSVRRFEDTDNNLYPYNDNLVMIRGVEAGISVAKVKQYVDEAIANNYWLVLVFHEISTTASTNPDDYEYTPAELGQIAGYVQSKNMPVVNMTDGIATSNTNLLVNGSFNNGIADNWTTDDPTNIIADSANHGSYPDPAKSLSIKAATGTGNTHLFSPQVPVSQANTYLIKSFVNITAMTSGQIGYWVDEYDAAGNAIAPTAYNTRMVITSADALRVRSANFTYKPTTAAVAMARLQVVVNRGSGLNAYVDNFQWFPESAINNPSSTPAFKPGDANGDGLVNIKDATLVSLNWGKTGATRAQGDVNGDGTVGIKDATLISLNWSK